MFEIKFFFWNIQDNDEKSIGPAFEALLQHHTPDILLLAETNVSDSYIASKSNLRFVHGGKKSIRSKSGSKFKEFKIYATQKNFLLTPVSALESGSEVFACELEVKSKSYLIFAVHLMSKLWQSSDDKPAKRAKKYRNYIEGEEMNPLKKYGGSIVFGDFNLNPFEKAFTDTDAFFAIDLKERPPKKLNKFNFFVNPMYSVMGHYSFNSTGKKTPPGTYYNKNKDLEEPASHFWNTLDGMIFRPELIPHYDAGNHLEIVDSIAGIPLFNYSNMTILSKKYSDHLPIQFSFKF